MRRKRPDREMQSSTPRLQRTVGRLTWAWYVVVCTKGGSGGYRRPLYCRCPSARMKLGLNHVGASCPPVNLT